MLVNMYSKIIYTFSNASRVEFCYNTFNKMKGKYDAMRCYTIASYKEHE
jgi:hypothetical protein